MCDGVEVHTFCSLLSSSNFSLFFLVAIVSPLLMFTNFLRSGNRVLIRLHTEAVDVFKYAHMYTYTCTHGHVQCKYSNEKQNEIDGHTLEPASLHSPRCSTWSEAWQQIRTLALGTAGACAPHHETDHPRWKRVASSSDQRAIR